MSSRAAWVGQGPCFRKTREKEYLQNYALINLATPEPPFPLSLTPSYFRAETLIFSVKNAFKAKNKNKTKPTITTQTDHRQSIALVLIPK